MATPQKSLSCAPAHAANMAADLGQHVIVLGVSANAREIMEELGNVLDHDQDAIEILARDGQIAFFRTTLEDAETLFFDLQRNRTHSHPGSRINVQFAVYGPMGMIHHWLGRPADELQTALAA